MRLTQPGHPQQRGMTLVELLIGLVIGLLVLAVVGTAFINVIRSSDDTLSSIKLNQEVRGLLGFMASEIRRAGYWENAATASIDSTITYDNPLTNRDSATGDVTDIWIHNDGSCLMYSYDLDTDSDDNYVSDGDPPPLLGYRLNDAGQIQATLPDELIGTDGETNACNGDEMNFEAVTDDRIIEVTGLSFSTIGSTCINLSADPADPDKEWTLIDDSDTTPACETIPAGVTVDSGDRLLEIRRIRISIQARHRNDNEIRTTLSDTVGVRNHRLLIQP